MRRTGRKKGNRNASETIEDGTQVENGGGGGGAAQVKGAARRNARELQATPCYRDFLREFCLNSNKTGVKALIAQFNELRAATQGIGNCPKTAFDANPTKNRYKDVFCVDPTRVVLTDGCDYIHANWVGIPEDHHRFICTQGPTDQTIADFWRMVWQTKSRSVVMLCDIVEQGKKKCEPYWPANKDEVVTYGTITVRNGGMEEIEGGLLNITKLEILDPVGAVQGTVEHAAWKHWPDRGVPDNYLACFRLLQRVTKHTPIIVHCSAGIGRTGTIVGIDIQSHNFTKGRHMAFIDVVKSLREHRHGSVQTDIQFLFMHRVLIAFAEQRKIVQHAEVAAFIRDYDEVCKARGL